jgi:hypothetical protein
MNDQTLHKKVKSYKYFDTDGVLLSPSQKKCHFRIQILS